jgi:hypothetical protein
MVAIVRQPLLVASQFLVLPFDLLVGTGSAKRGLVEDLALGDLRFVELAGLGDGGFLLVGKWTIIDAGLLVFLPEVLHRQIERALRAVVGH